MGTDRPPKTVPLWHVYYFELEIIKAQQTPGELCASPDCLNNSGQGLVPERAITENFSHQRALTYLHGVTTPACQAPAPHLPGNRLPPQCPRPLPAPPSLRKAQKAPCPTVRQPLAALWGSCTYKRRFVFSPVNPSDVNLIIRPAKEPGREKFFCPTEVFIR